MKTMRVPQTNRAARNEEVIVLPRQCHQNLPRETASSKRRRLEERSREFSDQAAHQRKLRQKYNEFKRFYDPDQDEDERRQNKQEMRNLSKALNDSRAEVLQAQSIGLMKTLEKADQLFRNVKQTSDATIDSRLLVTAADLSNQKIDKLTLGDSFVGVDVDDFVSKCIIFMNGSQVERERDPGNADPSQPPSTLTRRRRRRQAQIDEDEEGDAVDWEYLGRNAAFLANTRPCLSGFLLGPLSVQKKVRRPTRRRAREARADVTQALRPTLLSDDARTDQEDRPLADQCKRIRNLLLQTAERGMDAFNKEYNEDMTDEDEAQALMRKHHIADVEGGIPLFDFIINPKSFGQTVENMFYVSFLIKEGSAGLDFDSRGMPVLQAAEPKSLRERQRLPRNQAIFTLDFDLWNDIIESCGITESIIPHADEKDYDLSTI